MTHPHITSQQKESRQLATLSLTALATGVLGHVGLLIAGHALLSGVFLGVLLMAATLFALKARHIPSGKTALWGCAAILLILLIRIGILYNDGRQLQQSINKASPEIQSILEAPDTPTTQ